MATSSPDEVRERQRLEWRAASNGWRKWDKQLMRNLQPVSDMMIKSAGIASGQYVLDVATGSGEPALTIASIVGPLGGVVGVDISPEMLEVARERASSQGLRNVAFQVIEDENLSVFHDNTFDAVLCRLGLMFVPEPVKALKAFWRVLKSGGKTSVAVWGPPEKAPFFTTVMKAIMKHVPDIKATPPGTPGGPFGIPSPDMLRGFFVQAGFSNFNAQTSEIAVGQLDSAEEYWQYMSEVGGPMVILLSKLDSWKKQAIQNDVIESVRRMFPAGPVRLTGELIVGTCTKL